MTSISRTDSATYYVAVPANSPESGIYGIGTESAISDAHDWAKTQRPAAVHNSETGLWDVYDEDTRLTISFGDESQAREEAAMLGFSPRECTERLYRYVEAHGAAVGELRYVERDGLQDLDISVEDMEEALAHVDAGIETADTRALKALMSKDVVADAREYVNFYVWQVEDIDIESVVGDDREFRFALELAVQMRLLALIAERGLDNEDAIVAALDACRTKEDLQDVLNRVIAACSGNEPSFDADDFSTDFIAALADGTVLAWGQEGTHRGHGTRALLIYTTADNAREILSLDGSAELVDEDIAREAA